MRYVNALGKATIVRVLFGFLQAVILLEPLAIIGVILYFVSRSGEDAVPLPAVIWLVLAGMLALGLGMFLVVRLVFRRMYSTAIEVTRDGVRQLSPGKERVLRWDEVTAVRHVPYGRGQVALQLVTAAGCYTLAPYLVPDSPDAPRLQMGFGKMYWMYPDGRREPCDLEHSFALKIVREFAPSRLR